MPKQQSQLHSSLINMNNKYGKFLLSFSPFDKEFSLEKRLINFFSDWFFFHAQTYDVKNHIYDLDNIAINVSNDSYSSIVLLNTSIRNNIAIVTTQRP